MILKNPQALYSLRNLEKFEKYFLFAKLRQISTVYKEAVQARKTAPTDLMLHTNLLVQNNFCNIP